MGTRRLVGAGIGALLMAATLAVPAADVAAAAPSATNRATSASSASSVSHYRLVRSAQMRRLGSSSTAATLKAVTKAVNASEYTEGIPATDYAVTGVRVSGSWASATLRPSRTAELDPATVILQKSRGAWQVVDLGTAEVGCGLVPAAALKPLRLTCP